MKKLSLYFTESSECGEWFSLLSETIQKVYLFFSLFSLLFSFSENCKGIVRIGRNTFKIKEISFLCSFLFFWWGGRGEGSKSSFF